ncbi:hypothetical protein SNEBB_002943 [Seison nebaliae]|nr:hypothetical protein SNEBB_002943 [Seison nebaliae]
MEENHFAISLRLSDDRQQSMEEKLINFTNFRIYFLVSIGAEDDEIFLQQFHQQTENVEEFLKKMTLKETVPDLNDNAIHLLSLYIFNINVMENNKDDESLMRKDAGRCLEFIAGKNRISELYIPTGSTIQKSAFTPININILNKIKSCRNILIAQAITNGNENYRKHWPNCATT